MLYQFKEKEMFIQLLCLNYKGIFARLVSGHRYYTPKPHISDNIPNVNNNNNIYCQENLNIG